MRSTELQIKLKTLAAEARFIRRAEKAKKRAAQRARNLTFPYNNLPHPDKLNEIYVQRGIWNSQHLGALAGLHHHRTVVVRREARAGYIAYGFMRGKTYRQVENGTVYAQGKSNLPTLDREQQAVWKRAREIVSSFHSKDEATLAKFDEWQSVGVSAPVVPPVEYVEVELPEIVRVKKSDAIRRGLAAVVTSGFVDD